MNLSNYDIQRIAFYPQCLEATEFRQNPLRGIGDKKCWTKPLSGNLQLAMGIVKRKDHRTGNKDLAEAGRSGRLQQRLLDCRRELNGHKKRGGIQIILALIVYDSNILRLGSGLVWQHFVDPARRQQISVIRANTNHESSLALCLCWHSHQSKKRLMPG